MSTICSILVIHGPNLDLLGQREPGVYGTITLQTINQQLLVWAEKHSIEVRTFQSNYEGAIIDEIHVIYNVV